MSSKLTPYPSVDTISSSLLRHPPDAVPPLEELQTLQNELERLKQKTLERARKAGEDMRAIDETMRRVREREQVKAKTLDKVRKENGSTTPSPDVNGTKIPSHVNNVSKTAWSGSQPGSARGSLDPRKGTLEDLKKKKKKRKREDDSDDERDSNRPRKASPAHSSFSKPSKTSTYINKDKTTGGLDFSLSHSHSVPLLPPRPPVPPPPIPGPRKPTDVTEDFSKAKQPSQVLVNTFYTSIEPWIRNIKEEDIGFLEYAADDVEPYILPKLGRHYLEVWEEEDVMHYGAPLPGFTTGRDIAEIEASASASAGNADAPAPGAPTTAPLPKWDPSTLNDMDCLTEDKGHGPLTERLVAALLPIQDAAGWKGVKAAEDAMEGRPGGYSAAMARREKVNVSDLEERIRDTMLFHGLLEGIPDHSSRVDDPIATALRQAQSELRTVSASNKARKKRLLAIARDRLAYQEYVDWRDNCDRSISAMYAKLQKKDAPKPVKKKKKGEKDKSVDMNGTTANGILPPPCPAALGLSPDADMQLHVPESLRELIELRRKWVDVVGGEFKKIQQEKGEGWVWGLPDRSVYEGMEEEVRMEMDASPGGSARKAEVVGDMVNGVVDKGKKRAVEAGGMDVE